MMTAEAATMTPRIFLSFASADRSLVQSVKRLLLQQKEMNIFSTDSLSAGEDWAEKLKSEIARCDIFVTFLTPTSIESSWVLSELGAAWALEKPIIAVVSQIEILNRLPLSLFDARRTLSLTVSELEQPEAGKRILSFLPQKAL